MANHKSALKRHRQSLVRRARNASVKSGVKTVVKKVRVSIEQKDGAAAMAALAAAVPAIDKAASKGVIHRRAASRKISRLMRAAHKATAAR